MRKCTIAHCYGKLVAKGLCNKHYKKYMLYGDALQSAPLGQKTCIIEGCSNKHVAKGWCSKHYQRKQRLGDPLKNISYRTRGKGTLNKGYLIIQKNGVLKSEHIWIAEEAIGKPLPSDAQIHHVNGNGLDNRNKNLVICPNQTYHKLLHVRQRALDACGNANYRRCIFCKKHDDINNLSLWSNNRAAHKSCRNTAAMRYKTRPRQ